MSGREAEGSFIREVISLSEVRVAQAVSPIRRSANQIRFIYGFLDGTIVRNLSYERVTGD